MKRHLTWRIASEISARLRRRLHRDRETSATAADSGDGGRESARSADAGLLTQRFLTFAYVLALALIAALTVSGSALVTARLDRMRDDASSINVAGAQRMLSQRIAALSTDLLSADGELRQSARHRMEDALARLEASHQLLTVAPASAAHGTPELREHYFGTRGGLDIAFSAFAAHTASLLAETSTVGGPDPASVAALRAEALGPLLALLHHAVALHEKASDEALASARDTHLVVVLATLLLLFVEAAFLFRPMARRAARLAAELDREARVDALTGLLNRRAVNKALTELMKQGQPLAVIAIDLDHFKEANDAEGHDAGDALLRAAGDRLRRAVRPGDVVGRIGGDEFAAFLRGISNHDAAAQIAERIRLSLHQPVEHNGRSLRLGATLGVAVTPSDADDAEVVLRVADEALIRAKRERRGSIGRASRTDADRLLRATAILKAFDAGSLDATVLGLSAHFQPVLSLAGDTSLAPPVAFEALARWAHPDLGAVPPAELLEAIGPGRTFRLGQEVRGHALAAFKSLRARLPAETRLALNLSASEVARDDIGLSISRQIEASGVPLGVIDIEITEEVLLDRVSDRTLTQLAVLRGRGARLMLDDFGTGNSGLAQLLRLPLDAVKLDRQFIQRLGADSRAEEIVRATVSLAKGLGLVVIAEGVETEEQATLAARLGCDAAQGYLYARPMPLDALERWLADRAALAGAGVAILRRR